jgi:hypothetical protein
MALTHSIDAPYATLAAKGPQIFEAKAGGRCGAKLASSTPASPPINHDFVQLIAKL